MKGYIHIYCGDGKGKTTAAVGLAVRAAGRGKRVLIVRFLKTEDSGEVPMLRQIPGITVTPCDRIFGFVFRMTETEKAEAAVYFKQRFETACREAVEGGYDLLILDELMASCQYDMVPETAVVDFLKNRPENLEVVMTGRNPSDALVALADYVSEIRAVKHPFQEGAAAREGIEY
ncbi:MAG: cob(I)yrinic acid a,c-diamide adenosyltransferase [Lachnospiraceae bacterium]|nr:cob(I)yrinic acid a,c-diamide adenosyltransferase [Lachnospiraceae bacterium]